MSRVQFNVRDFGATGNAKDFDTNAIREAIFACHASGGGTVVFPSGNYLTAPFQLLSHTVLQLEPGALIIASSDINDYFISETSMESPRIGLIYARDAEDTGIVGKGTIDCRGTSFMQMDRPKVGEKSAADFERRFTRQGERYMRFENGLEDGPVLPLDRPGNLIQFMRCQRVTVRDVTILDGPNWTIHFDDCEDVVVSGINLSNNQLIPNSDGIHLTVSRNVRISDCHITAGDDCIALTCYGEPGRRTENVTVSNCILSSRSSGIRVGYGDNDVSNCLFQNLVIHSNRGVGIFQRNKGRIENIAFSDMIIHTRLHTGHWWGHGEPIHISTGRNPGATAIGEIRNIRFSNVTARSEAGILAIGCKDAIIKDVEFNNIRLTIVPSLLKDSYGGNMDLRPVEHTKEALFSQDEYGLYARNVEGLKIKGLLLTWEEEAAEYFADGVFCENCSGLDISGYEGRQPRVCGLGAALRLSDCRNVMLTNSRASESTAVFLAGTMMKGSYLFQANDLTMAKSACSEEAPEFDANTNKLPLEKNTGSGGNN